MKANEAPERLYITNDEKRFSDKCHSASTEKYVDDDIEYTRTDAFMKKAENFLEMLGYGFTITDNITHKNYDKEPHQRTETERLSDGIQKPIAEQSAEIRPRGL